MFFNDAEPGFHYTGEIDFRDNSGLMILAIKYPVEELVDYTGNKIEIKMLIKLVNFVYLITPSRDLKI